MSLLLRVAELNAAYAATIDTDRLESWPDFFVERSRRRPHRSGALTSPSR